MQTNGESSTASEESWTRLDLFILWALPMSNLLLVVPRIASVVMVWVWLGFFFIVGFFPLFVVLLVGLFWWFVFWFGLVFNPRWHFSLLVPLCVYEALGVMLAGTDDSAVWGDGSD